MTQVFSLSIIRINNTNMSKSPPRYIDQTVAKWAVANDDHVLKGPESALLTVLDSKEFSILDYDIVMRRARQALSLIHI